MTARLNFNILRSRSGWELLTTVVTAGVVAWFYTSAPVGFTVALLGLALVMLVLFKRPEYGVLFLVAFLPFRDLHLVSIIHLKRLFIWGFVFVILIRQLMASQTAFSRYLSLFTKAFGVFGIALVIALLKTAAELHTTIYLTSQMLTTAIFSDALVIVEAILGVYLIYYFMPSLAQIQRLLDVMLGSSALIAVLGIAQYFVKGTPDPVRFLFDPDFRFYGRASSVFSNPNGLGIFLAPIMMIAFVSLIWGNGTLRKRLGFILPVLLLDGWAQFLSFSRTAMVQILFSLLVLGALYYVKILAWKLSPKVVGFALLNVGLLFFAIQYYERFVQFRVNPNNVRATYLALYNTKITSDQTRKHSAHVAFQTFLKYPVLGLGYELIPGKRLENVEWVENQYLKILAEMGLWGFIPFLVMLGIIIKTGLRIWDRPPSQPAPREVQYMLLLLLTGVSAHVCGYLFADFLHVIAITGYLWIFSGAIFALERQLQELRITNYELKSDHIPNS